MVNRNTDAPQGDGNASQPAPAPAPSPPTGPPQHSLSRAGNKVFKSGPLYISSKGIGWTSWKKRWFILTRTSLVFFRSDPSVTPQKGGELNLTLGGIDLNNSGSVIVKADKKLLTVQFPDGRDGRTFTLKAETLEELHEWKEALESALAQAPSATLVMGQNGILNKEQTDAVTPAPAADSPEKPNDKEHAKSTIIGRPVLLALEEVDGSPSFLEKALRFIEEHGIKVEGILRQAASVDDVESRIRDACGLIAAFSSPSYNYSKMQESEVRSLDSKSLKSDSESRDNKGSFVAQHEDLQRNEIPLDETKQVSELDIPTIDVNVVNKTEHVSVSHAPTASIMKSTTLPTKSDGQANSRSGWGRTSAQKNLSMESIDSGIEEDEEVQKLEAAKMELQNRIVHEAEKNAMLQSSLEKRKGALQSRRIALEQEVAKLQEQLHKECELRVTLEAILESRGEMPASAVIDDKTKADLEEIAKSEAAIVNLEQKVDYLGSQLSEEHDLSQQASSHQGKTKDRHNGIFERGSRSKVHVS
uniref:PH domain-containing protein n=1 Tax=Kalanchoe fedtschenkoi TaxID=63787 RepID=A0A7N0UKF6_KALFE